MVVVGIVGYIKTPRGLKAVTTLFAQKLSECAIRRFYKRYRGKIITKLSTNIKKLKNGAKIAKLPSKL